MTNVRAAGRCEEWGPLVGGEDRLSLPRFVNNSDDNIVAARRALIFKHTLFRAHSITAFRHNYPSSADKMPHDIYIDVWPENSS